MAVTHWRKQLLGYYLGVIPLHLLVNFSSNMQMITGMEPGGGGLLHPSRGCIQSEERLGSTGCDQMIQDFLVEIFHIHEQFAAGGKSVHVTVSPPIRKKISRGNCSRQC
jgi:hypothetical protein